MNKKGKLTICLVLFLLLFSYHLVITKENKIEIHSNQNNFLVPAEYQPAEDILDEYETLIDILVDSNWNIGQDRYVIFKDNVISVYTNSGNLVEQDSYILGEIYAIDESTSSVTNIKLCYDIVINGVNYDFFVNMYAEYGYDVSFSLTSEYFLNELAIKDVPTFEEEQQQQNEEPTPTQESKEEDDNNDELLLKVVLSIVAIVLLIVGFIVFKNVAIASRKY